MGSPMRGRRGSAAAARAGARLLVARLARRVGTLAAPLLVAPLLALPGLAFAADAQITSLVDNPDPVVAGGIVEYTARVDNNAVDAALNVRLRFTVPAGASFVSATPPAGASCAVQSATVVLCTLGSVPASGAGPVDVALRWRALGPGPTTVSGTAEVLSDNDANPANNTQAQTTTVINGANLALAKTDAPDPVVGGSNITYTLTVSHTGPNDAGSLRIVDQLSPSTSFVSASGVGWTCGHSAGVVTCTRPGPHALGAGIPPVSLVARANSTGGTVTNSATVEPGAVGGVPDPDSTNNTVTADTTVLPGADVRIAQKAVSSPLPAIAGTDITFTIQPRNGGPATATNVAVTDTLPAGWSFVSASGPNWSCSNAGSTVTCTRATLPAGATNDITLVARAPGNAAVGPTGTSYTNTAGITASSTDPVAGNNSGSVNVNVLPDGADLRLSKGKTPNPVALGSNMTSTIAVTNNGPRVANGVLRVVERLTGETFVSASGVNWSCSASGSVVTCEQPNPSGLAVGASLPVLTLITQATAAGAVSNQACVGASVPTGVDPGLARPPTPADPNSTNDCATTTSNSTTTRPDLAIRKATTTFVGGDKMVAFFESQVRYTLTVTNNSVGAPQPATGIRIEDNFPGWVANQTVTLNTDINAPPGVGFACSVNAGNGRFVCTQTGGALNNGQAVNIGVTVQRPLFDGTFVNVATVTNTAEGDPNPANNTASDDVIIVANTDVEMTGKTVNPASVRAGEEATYVLSFRNNGPSSAAGVSVTDTFTFAPGDTGATVVSIASSKGGSTCSIGAGAQITPAAPAFTCSIGTLALGEAQTITLVVRPNWRPGNPARSFGNRARVDTTTTEDHGGGDYGNNERTASLPVAPAAVDLLVNKTDRVGAINFDPVGFDIAGTYLHYQVGITNNGPSFATGVAITETMTPPPGRRIRFVCDVTSFGGSACNPVPLCTGAGATSAPGVALPAFTCQAPAGTASTGAAAGTLAAGRTKNLFLRFQVLDQPAPTGDVFNNSATVSANEPDTQAANNTEGEATTTRQRVDLRVTKTATVLNPTLFQPFNWVVTVSNGGPGNSLQTDLTDTLPAGAVPTGPITWTRTLQPANGTCTLAGSVVSCGLGRLDAGGTATITIPVRFTSYPSGGTAINSATVDTDPAKTGGIDTPGGNNTGGSQVAVSRSSIAGTVFEDRDRTGPNGGTPQLAAIEPRIAGVAVRLTGTDAYGNAVDRTATTDASGNYLFDNLAPSNGAGYTITQTQPAATANGPVAPPTSGPGAPSAGGTYAGGGAAGNSSYAAVVLPASTAATNYHFPEVRQPTLGGFVYIDLNGNSVRDAGSDPAIAGATVRLLDANTLAIVATATTDASGAYAFTGLDPFTPYVLEQPLPGAPPGLLNGPVNPGLVGGAACASGCTAAPNSPAAGTDRITAIDLSSGASGTGFNFGERQAAVGTAISGTVYIDRNGNNAIDPMPADGRLAGVTITLRQGTDCNAPVVATTTTAGDGSYLFPNLTAGLTYTVCQTQPPGYGDGATQPGSNGSSAAANAITVAGLPPGGAAANNFGERAAALSGTVYLDNNNNGAQNGGEPGIGGVTMTLTGTDITGAAVSRTTVTDANGQWRFDDLSAAGTAGYTVTQQAAQPVVGGQATLNGRTTAGPLTAGAGGGSATAVTTGPSAISGIALPAGSSSGSHLFGEILPAALSGTVFFDVDGNGTQQRPADAGIGGVPLVITGTDDTGAAVTRNVTTAPDGSYAVNDLRPGTYTVTQPLQPGGTGNGITTAGSAGGTATPVGTVPSAIGGIVLGSGAASTGNNFAEVPGGGAIEGRVWRDDNNNGALDAGEPGIAGVTLELTGTTSGGAPVSRTTTTDAEGRYAFTGLAPGNYAVREPTQPPATLNGATVAGRINGVSIGNATSLLTTPSAVTAIALGANQVSSGNDFGEFPASAISGRVYLDNNGNGRPDAGETGLAGIVLVLTGTDDLGRPVNLTATTAADGSYTFADLRPGTYTVTQPTQPPGTVNGTTTAGSAGGNASTPADPTSLIGNIVLGPGTLAVGNNFAELSPSPDLRVSKSVLDAPFTVGRTGRYRLSVRNAGEAATSGIYTVSDRLPVGMALAATPTGAGWTCTGAAGATAFSCTHATVLAPGAALASAITATVNVTAAALSTGANNRVLVEGGGEIDARGPSADERALIGDPNSTALPECAAPEEHNACRTPTPVQAAAAIAGTVWLDNGGSSRVLDGADRRLQGWIVEVFDTTGTVVGRAVTGADGSYLVSDLLPGVALTVRFREPTSGVVFGYPVNGEAGVGSSGVSCDGNAVASRGASSCVGGGINPALSVVLTSGQTLQQQSLPVDPSGVVYDSALRQPVPGAVVTMAPVGACAGWSPATSVVGATLGGYRIDGDRISMTVGNDGFYQYLFAPAAPASCTFALTVAPPAGYDFVSRLIAPEPGALTPGGAPGSTFAVQPQAVAPVNLPGTSTTYYLTFVGGSAGANIIHNHIPVDPQLPTALAITKTGDRAVAEVGDSVRYSITVNVPAGPRPRQTTVVDRLPAGFTYIRGTATVNELPIADPAGNLGPTLAFDLGPMPTSGGLTLRYRVRVGVGAQQGDGINRALAYSCGTPGGCVGAGFVPQPAHVATPQVSFRVRVRGGVFATEACVLGKVFVDCNHNHLQDREELGIPGVRLLMSDGTTLVSDSEGKYSVCGVPPRSHVLKVDPLTLPRGSRLTTSSNRNLGDAGSLWLDLKNGELHRADFIEGSCSNTVLEQVKARRAQGEVRAPEPEKKGAPALRFDSKAHGKGTFSSPQQGTDGANQLAPRPRSPASAASVSGSGKTPAEDETNKPTPALPMNRPAPRGRDSGTAPDAPAKGGGDAAP